MATYAAKPLPYAQDALAAKGLSAETVALHYVKHHCGYAARLTKMAADQPGAFPAGRSIADIIRAEPKGEASSVAYKMAAQIFNHDFYWRAMTPLDSENDATRSAPKLLRLLAAQFGSFEQFAQLFSAAAVGHFGSGWGWRG